MKRYLVLAALLGMGIQLEGVRSGHYSNDPETDDVVTKKSEHKKKVKDKTDQRTNDQRIKKKRLKNLEYDREQRALDKQEADEKKIKKSSMSEKEKRDRKLQQKAEKLNAHKSGENESQKAILEKRSDHLVKKIKKVEAKKDGYVLPEGQDPKRHTREADQMIKSLDKEVEELKAEFDRIQYKMDKLETEDDPKAEAGYQKRRMDDAARRVTESTERRKALLSDRDDHDQAEHRRTDRMPKKDEQDLHRRLRTARAKQDKETVNRLEKKLGVKKNEMPGFRDKLHEISVDYEAARADKEDSIAAYDTVQPYAGTLKRKHMEEDKRVEEFAEKKRKKHIKFRQKPKTTLHEKADMLLDKKMSAAAAA